MLMMEEEVGREGRRQKTGGKRREGEQFPSSFSQCIFFFFIPNLVVRSSVAKVVARADACELTRR